MFKNLVHGKVAIFIDAANILYSQRTLGWSKGLIERAKFVALPKIRDMIEKFKEPGKPALDV